jgi:Tfp pilus assembly protein PilV
VLSFELKKKRKRSKNNDWTRIMAQKTNRRSGLTLVEMMLAAAILMVALVGSMAYRYYATLDARKADIQMTAARIGITLLEGLIAAGGPTKTPLYDPTANFPAAQYATKGIKVETATFTVPDVPDGTWTSFGTYQITSGGVVYYARLSTKSIPPTEVNVKIGWRADRQAGALASTDKVMGLTRYMSE